MLLNRAIRALPSAMPPMNAASTRLTLQTLLPNARPARRNHSVSNMSAETPERKKIRTSVVGMRSLPVG